MLVDTPIKSKVIPNQQYSNKLHKPNTKECHIFVDNMGADLADMQLISRGSEEINFLLWFINIYIKYACVILLKDEKGKTKNQVFQIIEK